MICVRESLALETESKGAKSHIKEFQRNLLNALNMPKIKNTESNKSKVRKVLNLVFYVINIKVFLPATHATEMHTLAENILLIPILSALRCFSPNGHL